MDDKNKQSEPEVELLVEEDRKRLLLSGVGLLLLIFALLFCAVFAYAAAEFTGQIALLLIVLVAVAVVWFVSKRMGRLLGKFFGKVDVCEFRPKELVIFEKADKAKALEVPYVDIKGYELIRQGSSLRLLLWGSWVKHPSGYEYVAINRPFMADSLDELEAQIKGRMVAHHVKRHKK